jgi:hypothetical protein
LGFRSHSLSLGYQLMIYNNYIDYRGIIRINKEF